MQETWVWSLGQGDPLEKERATHSSILAWEIPWTEDPGRLQFMGSQRVGHNWVTNTHTHNSLLVVSFANIFSHSADCLFILSVVSSAVQKLLHVIRFHLFNSCFISFVFGDRGEKNSAVIYVRVFCPGFLWEFYDIQSTFRSSIHFEFIFIYSVTECSNFLFHI